MVIGLIGAAGGAVLDTTMGPLITAMDKLNETVRESFQFADRAQKASLALGVSYEQTSESLGSTMKGLRGDISQKFQAGIAGMEVGLQGNTAGIAKLINQQMLTGTQYQQTAKAFASLEVGLGLSRGQTNALAENMIGLGDKWEVSTDKLVKAMENLKDTLPAQRIAGMGPEVMQAVAMMQAKVGPQLAPELSKIMRAIFDPSVEGTATLMRLGIGNIREKFSQDRSALQNFNLLESAFKTAAERFNNIAGGSDKAFHLISRAQQAYGKTSIHFTTLVDALNDRIAKTNNTMADYGSTLKNLMKEAFVGFQGGIAKFYPHFKEVMETLSRIAGVLGERFENFADSLGGEKGAAETMRKFNIAIVKGAIILFTNLEGIFNLFESFVVTGIPTVFNGIKDGFHLLVRHGGYLDLFTIGILLATEALTTLAALGGVEGAAQMRTAAIEMRKNLTNVVKLVLSGDDLNHPDKQGALFNPARTQAFLNSVGGQLSDTYFSDLKAFVHKPKTTMEKAHEWMADNIDPMGLGKSPFMKGLKSLLLDLAGGEDTAHDDAEEQKRLLGAIEENTDTKSGFLGESANLLGDNVRSILGFGGDATFAEILDILETANDQRDAALVAAGVGAAIGKP